VRRAAWSLLVLIAMAATFTMGRTTRGGPHRPDATVAVVADLDPDDRGLLLATGSRERQSGPTAPDAQPDVPAIVPALGAPIADAEAPIVFPGYVLPDDNREEPAHEGS
jgi:hypothetical protein